MISYSCSLMMFMGIYFSPSSGCCYCRGGVEKKRKWNIEVFIQLTGDVVVKGNYWSWLWRSILWLDLEVDCPWMHGITWSTLVGLKHLSYSITTYTNNLIGFHVQNWLQGGGRYINKRGLEFACGQVTLVRPLPLRHGSYGQNHNLANRESCPDHTKLSVWFQLWNCWGLCSDLDVGAPLFTLLQLEMPTDGVSTGRCD
jgi:hypothetical protein